MYSETGDLQIQLEMWLSLNFYYEYRYWEYLLECALGHIILEKKYEKLPFPTLETALTVSFLMYVNTHVW